MTRAALAVLIITAVGSFVSPTLDRLLSTVLLVAVGAVVLGWLAHHVIGEIRLAREYTRPLDPAPAESTTSALPRSSCSAPVEDAAEVTR